MAKAPALMAAPAAASIAKLAMPASMSATAALSRLAPSAAQVAKLPLNIGAASDKAGLASLQPSWFEKMFGKGGKDKMRDMGLSMMQQAMGQQQQQAPQMQLSPFQPQVGGGGGGGQPQLQTLMQQLGMNKIQ